MSGPQSMEPIVVQRLFNALADAAKGDSVDFKIDANSTDGLQAFRVLVVDDALWESKILPFLLSNKIIGQ